MKRWIPDLHSLSAQMILSFVALALLTTVAAGLPAIWLIREQLDRQAWAQLDQGSLASQALYAARENELTALATLTAERPTLRELLTEGEQDALATYLSKLQEGAGLDLVLVCDSDNRATAQVGEAIADDLCAESKGSGFHAVSQEPSSRVWLFAAQPLADEMATSLGTVIVGVALDDKFALEMRDQTGLDQALFVEGEVVATTLPARRLASCAALDGTRLGTFSLDDQPYYATCFPLASSGLEAEVALETAGIAITQRYLVSTLIGTVLAVAVVASLLGIFLARRIGQPLAHLADAASAMSEGDLTSPLAVEARVREVTLLAQALEGARSDLRRTLAELSQEKAWTDHLLEAIVEGIVTLDHQGRITFFSHGAERITGWPRDQVMGQPCDQIFEPTETDEPFSQLVPVPGRRQKIPVEMHDGREAILAVTGARLLPPDGEDAQVALVFRDVSEAEAVHRLLGHFLANVAHEFRTPLSALAASVELLLDQAPDLSDAELAELLTSLHLGVLGLQTLIDNLLESASIEAGHFRVHPRPSNLAEIVAEAIGMMQPLLDRRGQHLVVELPAAIPVVQADPRRTLQVLVNLLSNASRYGPDEAEIEISAAVRGDWVRVGMADSGPGVPPEYRQDLFRRFAQPGLGNDQAQVGAGLGLSVVKTVVEAHGGAVGIDDHEGGGSVFWFTLPVEKGL
jgi:two-component system phosphate regulon sensor histidine kinase PhoR